MSSTICIRPGCVESRSIHSGCFCEECRIDYINSAHGELDHEKWAAAHPLEGKAMRAPAAPTSLTSPLWYSWMDPQPKEICQQLNYNLGCVVKYVCRQGLKPDTPALDDLRKAMSYLEAEIKRQQDAQHKALTKGNE